MDLKVFVVDDEKSVRESVAVLLEDEGFQVVCFNSGEDFLANADTLQGDCLVSDVWLPGIDGIELVRRVKAKRPELPIIVMSGHGNIETAVRATKEGAYDFIEKPLSSEKFLLTVKHGIEAARAKLRIEAALALEPTWEIIGKSPPIKRAREEIKRAALASAPVLILGENGSGKELVARMLHQQSSRASGVLVELNCAAIPDELIESELFGHEKGAFTGAYAQKKGKFELARGGTFFLDEIGDMSLKAQAKVLRVIQEQTFERVGGTQTLKTDARIIAATNRDLGQLIKDGKFREDLFYRLNVIPLKVPALRVRGDDILELAKYFLDRECRRHSRPLMTLSAEVETCLMNYPWPGNVRELKNMIERWVIMMPGVEIGVNDLPEEMQNVVGTFTEEPEGSSTLRGARNGFEKRFIEARLAELKGNVAKTAQSLGMERTALYRKLKSLGIVAPDSHD